MPKKSYAPSADPGDGPVEPTSTIADFGEQWSGLLYAGVADLGLKPADIYDLTPRHLLGMLKRVQDSQEARENRADYRMSWLTIGLWNFLYKKQDGTKWEGADFFPALTRDESTPVAGFPTVEELMAGRRATEERLARIDAGLPVDDVQMDPAAVRILSMVTDFTTAFKPGGVTTSDEPITRPQ